MNLKASFNNCLLVFVTMNLLQSYFSPILQDEALYWNFAQHLDWGYFDHPPMVALLVKIGGLFFSRTLGVRLMTVLLMGVLVKIIWNFIPLHQRKNKHAPLLYFGILFSIPACNVYSFVTTPDVPLLFFSGLYLLAFLKFTKKNNTKHLLFLGIAAALLLYSKYHGALVIFLTVLCQPKLLKKRNTYLAGLVAILLLLPHLYWQYKHDFISVQYHLFERSKVGFESSNVLGAFFGFVGILNPGFVIVLATSLRKNSRIYKKGFFFNVSPFHWIPHVLSLVFFSEQTRGTLGRICHDSDGCSVVQSRNLQPESEKKNPTHCTRKQFALVFGKAAHRFSNSYRI